MWNTDVRRRAAVALLTVVAATSVPQAPSTAAETITVTWTTRERTLSDGRTYFVQAPSCTPKTAAGCVEYAAQPRALVVWLHAANAAEDKDTANTWLNGLHNVDKDTIVAFAVSKGGTKRFDAGLCCTTEAVADVDYLNRLVDDVAGSWTIDRDRVGLMGLSNGGMLALRATCERPAVFSTSAALAGVYDGTCNTGQVQIAQWHGSADTTVPLNGGQVTILNKRTTVPAVVSLSQRMKAGSTYELTIIPGRGHAMSWSEYRPAMKWVLTHSADG